MNFEKFCAMLGSLLPDQKEIVPTDRLSADLGLCSFDMMVLIDQAEECFGVSVDVTRIRKGMTVGELFTLFND